ncbi:hypothetical protein [Sphingobacterium puteale]|uniref:hypothetical protein n=1 Tax=Sphingobacterium puteale TaxID=2420510 RepID=UPI001601D0A9|nr:hypothetical protein [Sphingobacterium puteale]
MNNKKLKKNYISPRIKSLNIELEQGLAAGSAQPTSNVSNDVQQSWDKADDDNRGIDW